MHAVAVSATDVGIDFTSDGKSLRVLDDINVDVAPGGFVSVVGPSGCGKSTFLKILAGLVVPTRGDVRVGSKVLTEPTSEVTYLFQDYSNSIFPWKTVRQNVLFGLRHGNREHSRRSAEETQAVDVAIRQVGLAEFDRHYPWQLSGGMQQRVAVARALAAQPKALLMDEPFGSVDALTRSGLQDLVLVLWREERFTVIFVTHDIDEAVYLADRVIVLGDRPTRVVADIPVDLERPRHQLHTRNDERFLQLRERLFSLIVGRQETEVGPAAQMNHPERIFGERG